MWAFKKLTTRDELNQIKSDALHRVHRWFSIFSHFGSYLSSFVFFYKKISFTCPNSHCCTTIVRAKKKRKRKKHPYKNRAINFFPRHKFNWSFHVCRLDSMTLMQIVSFEKVHFSNSNERIAIAIAIACHATWCRYYLFQLY